MYGDRAVALLQIYRVERLDPIKPHDVPEVPTHEDVHDGDGCEGDVEREAISWPSRSRFVSGSPLPSFSGTL